MNIPGNPVTAELVSAADRDSLHTLALATVPLEHPMLRRARMVKNNRLTSALEVYRDRESGSGQIDIDKLPRNSDFPTSIPTSYCSASWN